METERQCIRCDRIVTTFHDGMCVSDGTMDEIMPGYGSRHDLDVFAIAVCDECLDVLKQRGAVVRNERPASQ